MNLTENYKIRLQELAGIGLPQSESQTLAKGFKEFKQIMGSDSIDKILNYIRIELKKSFIVDSIQEDKITFSNPATYFLIFKGYIADIASYQFDIGYTDSLGQEVFSYEFQFDMEKNPCNLKSLNFNSKR